MQHVESGYLPPKIEILFHRIDKKVIEEETEKIKAMAHILADGPESV